ncbi:MAG: hypothetical protein A2514_03370 [Gammaproteobacteria bacterium RIFOXYD12_FULL_61_37]|nr:MAG: hypothetical protein A2514_03370 [Gammaproteobacteria bacterium RIFOXYD12_FULL_61_37]
MKQEQRQANRERWQAEIDAWRASGERLSAWARERGLSRDALEYWKGRLPASRSVQGCSPLTLIPLRPERPVATDTVPIELAAARPGWRIRLAADFDAACLFRLLDVLESRC